MNKVDLEKMVWTRQPKRYKINANSLVVETNPFTDLWQRTYYKFRNDNAPVFQMDSSEPKFSFLVKVNFSKLNRYDQSGVVIYINSDNWIKASIEGENQNTNHLGCVVTNNGYSDWSTQEISTSVQTIWFRLSRRESDFKIEYSLDGEYFSQLRICHLFNINDKISFGVYACSPEDNTMICEFSNFELLPCTWLDHDGQQPDSDLL